MKFIDEARIEVFAGRGGNGVASFRREVRSFRRPGRRRRRQGRQRVRGGGRKRQHPGGVPLRQEIPGRTRRARPRRRLLRQGRRRHRAENAGGHGDHRPRHRRAGGGPDPSRPAHHDCARRQGRPGQYPFQILHQPRAASVHAGRAGRAAHAEAGVESAGRRRPVGHAQRRQVHLHPRGVGGAPRWRIIRSPRCTPIWAWCAWTIPAAS